MASGWVDPGRKKWVPRLGIIAVLILFTGIVLSEYLCRYCPQEPGEGRTYVKGCDGHQVYLTFAESVAPTIVWIVGGLSFLGVIVYNRSINKRIQKENGWERYDGLDV